MNTINMDKGDRSVGSDQWLVAGGQRSAVGGRDSALRPSSLIPRPLSSDRRGILLILVLAVLAMFAMIAVTFVIISNHARDTADSHKRFEQVTDPPEKLLRQAAMQVFRGPKTNTAGTPDSASVMGAHSLLEDIYGNEYVFGTLSSSSSAGIVTGFPQLLNIPIGQLNYFNASGAIIPYTAPETIVALASRVGCVLTITGPSTNTAGYGQSTRIVAASATTSTIQVAAFPDGSIPPALAEFTINSVPFSGTGFGYDSASKDLISAIDPATNLVTTTTVNPTAWPIALLPNSPINRNPLGGTNEGYDAADHQNLLLAAQVPIYGNPLDPHEVTSVQTLPSLHRPALVRYWANRIISPPPDLSTTAGLNAAAALIPDDLLRASVLRPLSIDHPNFTGSNSGQQPFNPLWNGTFIDANTDGICDYSNDVDTDGDGVPDSVWVDLGMPVRQTADGRLYKPLFAILCVDLDGRLNVNAHGSIPQTTAAYSVGAVDSTPAYLANGATATILPRGLGFGPAEINLRPLFAGSANPDLLYKNLLGVHWEDPMSTPAVPGNWHLGQEGRYGQIELLNSATLPTILPAPGASGGVDALSRNKWFEYAGEQNTAYWWGFMTSNAYIRDSFGSPPDIFGVGGVGLDLAGRPLYMNGMGNTIADNPYELNLDSKQQRGLPTGNGAADNPFSPAELERILRPFDCDAPALPNRLLALSEETPGNPTTSWLLQNRHSVTTESWDLPVPAVPPQWRVADRLKTRMMAGGLTADQAVALLPQILPTEVLAGLKMNVNRPLGNGRADDPNYPGVVDAPETPALLKKVTLSGQTVPVSYDPTGAMAGNPLQARQLMAQHLYVMALTLADRGKLITQFGDAEEAARAVAQWAVNVVDFRDRDNIMTPFDYDPNFAYNDGTHPITGWNPPGDFGHRIWGCEKPELLITETTAFHDRKTEDLNTETPDGGEGDGQTGAGFTTDAAPDKDGSFDQKSEPQGSLFVELYNPAGPFDPSSDATDTNPAYLAGTDMSGTSHYLSCVRLNQVTLGASSCPVWRLAITAGGVDSYKDLNDPQTADRPSIERSVYFVDPTLTLTGASHGQKYYPNNVDIAPILPGRYAVIGPAASTFVGTRTDDDASKTRRILLTTNNTPNASWDQVEVMNNQDPDSSTNDLPTGASGTIKPPVAVVIDEPRRLSVSEPTGGYVPQPDLGTGFYDPPRDMPFDESRGDVALAKNGTTVDYRIVHLQRLANPRKPWKGLNMDGTMPADYNPYITIDSQPVDLTVFNGLDTSGHVEPNIVDDTVMFASHQRGKTNLADDGNNNLWKQRLNDKTMAVTPQPSPASPTDLHIFKYILQHTLGYLNTTFGVPNSGVDPTDSGTGWRSYRGDPQAGNTFPWLTWNNRPYVSQLELLLVPWNQSSQLLRTYNIAQPGDPYSVPYAPFPHLMNLFLSGGTKGEELHRVLEYLNVPSPFVGSGVWANPNSAANSTGSHTFRPPFCRIPNYREPGRINLNTIYSQDVFDGLMNRVSEPSWTDFILSRRGASGDILAAPALDCPTEFARPFRSFAGASLGQPVTSLNVTPEIDGTLLRKHPTASPTQPLFQADSANVVNETTRNPYFRYQGIQRLGNLVTTRSNVYAVWITVGYFEVEEPPTGSDPALYPDGYALARELGTDTGEIERHRAFYIFDRSIPVAFQRGQDLNIDKAIRVDRFIE